MKNILYIAVAFAAFALSAWAAEPVVCTLTTSTSTAAQTKMPTTGTCSWGQGANVLMQCTTDVYINTQGHTPSGVVNHLGAWYYDGGVEGSAATSSDQRVDFTSNTDPYPIYLDNGDQHISVLAVTSAGTCKFMTTKRPKPGQAK
jgi:hypothetical protein